MSVNYPYSLKQSMCQLMDLITGLGFFLFLFPSLYFLPPPIPLYNWQCDARDSDPHNENAKINSNCAVALS